MVTQAKGGKGSDKGQVSRPGIPDLPPAPEFGADTPELLEQQALSSILNVQGPFGGSQITGDPTTGFTRETTLGPELQGLLDQALGTESRDRATQAYFDRAQNLLRPERERQLEQERVSLAARGLPPGSELYGDITDASARQRAEQDERLALSAILQGEQQRGRDISNLLNLTSQITPAQGPNINTLASYQIPYQAETLPYLQEINRQNLIFGADVGAAQQSAANKAAIKQGLLSGAGEVGGAIIQGA